MKHKILLFAIVIGCLGLRCSAEDRFRDQLNRPIKADKNVVFREVEGTKLRADIFRPESPGPHPLVLMIHGGAWSAGDKWDLRDHARELAQAGYVAVAINYRLAPRVMLDKQLDDCRYALAWARENCDSWDADATRVAVWGYSAGAHLGSLVALQSTKEHAWIRAVVAGGAPCEFSFIRPNSQVLKYVIGGSRITHPEAYSQASPINHVHSKAPPFFFFHGTTDALVPMSSSRAMSDKLLENSVQAEYHVVEKRGHLLTFLDFEARRKAIEFLDSTLKDGK